MALSTKHLSSTLSRTIPLLLAGIASSFVHAHTPYLVPATFDTPRQGWVTLDAAFADTFFTPDVVFDDSEFQVMDTNGEWGEPATVYRLKTRAVIEHQLIEQGTYRFSTGARHGAVFRVYELDGERKSTRNADEPLPEGAVLLDHFQAITLAETYLTRGGPTTAALAARGSGLELLAETHPNDIYDGEGFRVQALFDGQPVAGQVLHLFAAGDGDDKPVLTVETNDSGLAELTPLETGTYLLRARYRGAAPEGAPAPHYSFTYTLAFDVAEQ